MRRPSALDSLPRVRIDLHTHSDRSDGTELAARARARGGGAGLDVLALTDHDTTDGLGRGRAGGPRGRHHAACRGIEVSRSTRTTACTCSPTCPTRRTRRWTRSSRRSSTAAPSGRPPSSPSCSELGVDIDEADVAVTPGGAAAARPPARRRRAGRARRRWRPRRGVRDAAVARAGRRTSTRYSPTLDDDGRDRLLLPVASPWSPTRGVATAARRVPTRRGGRAGRRSGWPGSRSTTRTTTPGSARELRAIAARPRPGRHRLQRLPRHRQDRSRPRVQHHRPEELNRLLEAAADRARTSRRTPPLLSGHSLALEWSLPDITRCQRVTSELSASDHSTVVTCGRGTGSAPAGWSACTSPASSRPCSGCPAPTPPCRSRSPSAPC